MPLVVACGADHHKQLDGDLSIAPMELSPHITLPSLTKAYFSLLVFIEHYINKMTIYKLLSLENMC